MTWKVYLSLIVLGLLLVLSTGATLYLYKQNNNLQVLLTKRNTELQEANLSLGRAHTTLGDANALVSRLNQQIKDEIKKREGLLSLYVELEGRYKAEKDKVKVVTRILYKDREVPLPVGKIFVKLEDGTYSEISSMKINYTDFRITIEGDAVKQTLSYKLHQRFRGVFVESRSPGGLVNHYAELYETDDKGKDVGKIELTNFRVIRADQAPANMYWLNPKLDLSLGYGVSGNLTNGFAGDIGISLSNYGTTKNDISWKFFRFGVGFLTDKYLTFTFSPVQYNIARHLPLVSNLWATPSIGADVLNKTWMTSLTLGVVF